MIKTTTNYGMFKDITGNRILNKSHVNQLTKEIQMQNLLEYCPIIVNEKNEVIDGQHRLQSAIALGVEIPYVVVEGLTIRNVIRLNNSQKRWMLKDYVALHISHGNPNYIELEAFCQHWKIPYGIACVVMNKSKIMTTGTLSFREGNFELGDMEQAEYMMQIATQLRAFFKSSVIWREESLYRALVRAHKKMIIDGNTHDLEELVACMEKQGYILPLYRTTRDYLRDFENIMNAGKPNSRYRLF